MGPSRSCSGRGTPGLGVGGWGGVGVCCCFSSFAALNGTCLAGPTPNPNTRHSLTIAIQAQSHHSQQPPTQTEGLAGPTPRSETAPPYCWSRLARDFQSVVVIYLASMPGSLHSRHTPLRAGCRGTSLIRNNNPLGPYSRTMPRALWWP